MVHTLTGSILCTLQKCIAQNNVKYVSMAMKTTANNEDMSEIRHLWPHILPYRKLRSVKIKSSRSHQGYIGLGIV